MLVFENQKMMRLPNISRTLITHRFPVTLPSTHQRLTARCMNITSQTKTTIPITARDPLLASWLLGTGTLVFGMVVLGGVTRLTRSGLSMVDWKPLGRFPPSTPDEWTEEFDKYRRFPEYQRQNQDMTLGEFKNIWYMEWAHRTYGRVLGVIYGVPLVYFLVSGRAKRAGLTGNLVGLLFLGAGQGLVGWWMVQSGLQHDIPVEKEVRVSPYRLTAHLAMAVTLYSGLIWAGMNARHGRRPSPVPRPAFKLPLHMWAGVLLTTMVSGAFVAGNDAGRAFNDWPFYAGRWIPEGIWKPDLSWRNLVENTPTVQFDHRNLAYATLAGSLAVLAKTETMANSTTRNAVRLTVAAVWAQAGLGIITLMNLVPVSLGAAHQAGALTVWTLMVRSMHTIVRGVK